MQLIFTWAGWVAVGADCGLGGTGWVNCTVCSEQKKAVSFINTMLKYVVPV